MNEELKIIISAEVGKLKQAVKSAQKEVKGLGEESKKTGETFHKAMEKMGKVAVKVGKKIVETFKKIMKVSAAAVVGIGTAAVKEYAKYEQLTGGINKLFKTSSDDVMKYANNAYKTAGLSANQYMEQVTNFSASLINSLGGDTAKAAKVGDMAIQDMADNASVFGTSIDDIQHAYQGFAKGNYTMLDNLKLGYSGTREEMLRLLADAEKISGIHYDISSLADQYEAIHVIQQEYGIAGNAAEEAAKTISGSLGMVKASFSNLLVGIADDNANFQELVNNFVESVGCAFDNLVPRIGIAFAGISQVVSELAPKIVEAIPGLLDTILPAFIQAVLDVGAAVIEAIPIVLTSIFENLVGVTDMLAEFVNQIMESWNETMPMMITMFTTLIMDIANSISENAPLVVENLLTLIQTVLQSILNNLPALLNAAITLFMGLVQAIPKVIPQLTAALPDIISAVLDALIEAIPVILDGAVQLFTACIDAIPIIIPELIAALPTIIDTVINALIEALPVILDGAVQLFLAIIDAIPIIIPELVAALPDIIDSVVTTLIDNLPLLIEAAVELFMGIVTGIIKIIPKAIEKMKELVKKLKDKLKFKWKLPELKMPHISITGKFSLKPLSVPHFSISWHELGGVFDSAHLFGYGGGVHGLGENGAEAIVPLEKNTKWLDRLATMLAQKQGSGQPIVLQVDGKTFAQVSCDSINDLTRQTGSLPLVIA